MARNLLYGVMSSFIMHRFLSLALVLAGAHIAGVSLADADAKVRAREHFGKGVTAFNERRFAEAAEEFQSAYGLAPAFPVLYNIGQVSVALGRPVEAVAAFEQYLTQGASAIPRERAVAVQVEIERQRALLGTILFRVQPDGAEIRIDGRSIGKSPFREPVPAAAGSRTVFAVSDGHVAQMREIQLSPKAQIEVEITLEPARAKNTAPPGPSAATPGASAKASSSGEDSPDPAAVAAKPSEATPVVVPARNTSPSTPEPPPASQQDRSAETLGNAHQRTWGYLVGATGLVAAGLGVVIAATSLGSADHALGQMRTARNGSDWDSAKLDLDAAKRQNTIGWTAMVGGSAAAIAGTLLVITAPTKTTYSKWKIAPWTTAAGGGLCALANW